MIVIKDVIVTLAAFIGMVLSIYNFFRARSADRVKLEVIPKASSFQGTDQNGEYVYRYNRDHYDLNHPTAPPDTLSLKVINMGKFAITVNEVGLQPSWSRTRMALVAPIVVDRKPWPRQLEPRESVVVQFDATKLLGLKKIGSVRRAYASTVCGTTCYGTSGALRELIRIAQGVA